MKTVQISEFKARCIAIIDEMNRDGSPVEITRRGVPVARLEPVSSPSKKRVLGTMNRMKIKSDIVHADSSADWDMEST